MPDLLTTKQLAEYLQLSERSVYRMLERGELPATRVGGQWRFRKSAVDQWLDQGGVMPADDVSSPDNAGSAAFAADAEEQRVAVAGALTRENIIPDLQPGAPHEVLAEFVARLRLPEPVDRGVLLERLLERERLCSTALADGIALPHTARSYPRLLQEHDLVAIARTSQPVDFGALDGNRTSVFVLVLARDERSHLILLAKVARLLREPGVRGALHAGDAPRIMAVLAETEATLFAGAASALR